METETETEVEGEVEVAEARNHGWKQKQRTPEEADAPGREECDWCVAWEGDKAIEFVRTMSYGKPRPTSDA